MQFSNFFSLLFHNPTLFYDQKKIVLAFSVKLNFQAMQFYKRHPKANFGLTAVYGVYCYGLGGLLLQFRLFHFFVQ